MNIQNASYLKCDDQILKLLLNKIITYIINITSDSKLEWSCILLYKICDLQMNSVYDCSEHCNFC